MKSVLLKEALPNILSFKAHMQSEPTQGYCERNDLNNMNQVSNQAICGGSKRDIAFHFTVEFSVNQAALYSFKVPTDFGFGGYSLMDGVVVKQT